jgi:heat shock protein HtpX
MLGFGALFGLLGATIGFVYNDYMISLWVIIGVIVYIILQYYFSSKLAVLMMHAQPMAKEDNPRLYRLVENMAITIGIPTPAIYIIQDNAPNAFAAGRNPNDAILGFTTGLLNSLDKQELEGVISHEMGHIKNYDVRFKTIIFAMVAAIALLVDIAIRMLVSGGRNKNAAPLLLIGLVVIVIIWPISHLLQAAAGREREYLADATGAEITRYPEGLASALSKISQYEGPALRTSTSTSMLFFEAPERKRKKNWFTRITATHPPIEERIERLRTMGM